MFLAEWKKILRQRWFLWLTLVFFVMNLALFVYRQRVETPHWIAAVPWYGEYRKQLEGMDSKEQEEWIFAKIKQLGDFQGLIQVMEGLVDQEYLDFLLEENPNLVEEFEESGFGERREELDGRIAALSHLSSQLSREREYPEFLASIRENYEHMRDNAFYDNRPYAKALGEKTVEEFEKLKGLELEPGIEYGIEALLNHSTGDLLILVLAACICGMTVMQERSRDLFGLMKSCRSGRGKLAAVKFLTVISAVLVLCGLFYGSIFGAAVRIYGLGPLERSIQSVSILNGSGRMLSVGGFLADAYIRTALSMAALACLMECLMIGLKNSLVSLGILGVAGIIWAGLYRAVSPISGMAQLHFLNPVAWFQRVESYGSYNLVSVFGKPVSIIPLNLMLVCLLLAGATAVGIYLFCTRPMTEGRGSLGLLSQAAGKLSEHLPYPGNMAMQEWGKQLLKNRLLFLVLLAGAAVWMSAEKYPANLNRENRQYRDYILEYQGPMTKETMDAILEEQARLDQLEQEFLAMGARLEAGEITEEQYQAADMIVKGQLERRAPLNRVSAQAQELLEYEKEHGVRLYLTDEIAGEFLLEQKEYDQRQGVLAMLAAIVLLSGIFPGEQRHQMLNLLRCTKHGHLSLFLSKVSLGIVLAALMAAGMFWAKLSSVQALYGFVDWKVPIQSFSAARQFSGSFSIQGFLMLSLVLELVGMCCLGAAFLALSLWMKNRMYAILTGAAIFVLPLLLGWMGIAFPWAYSGNRVFFFPCQMAAQGLPGQLVYLFTALAAAALFLSLAWKKYQNGAWR